jgi:hypothetical protein
MVGRGKISSARTISILLGASELASLGELPPKRPAN